MNLCYGLLCKFMGDFWVCFFNSRPMPSRTSRTLGKETIARFLLRRLNKESTRMNKWTTYFPVRVTCVWPAGEVKY